MTKSLIRKLMKKLVVLASVLTVAAAFRYVGMSQVEAKSTRSQDSSGQTRTVVNATTAFLTALSANERQKVQFAFEPQAIGTNAPFHRTPDGGVAAREYPQTRFAPPPIMNGMPPAWTGFGVPSSPATW